MKRIASLLVVVVLAAGLAWAALCGMESYQKTHKAPLPKGFVHSSARQDKPVHARPESKQCMIAP